MHLVQTLALLPEAKRAHCKLGYLRVFEVGLNLPRSFTRVVLIWDVLPQTAHSLDIVFILNLFRKNRHGENFVRKSRRAKRPALWEICVFMSTGRRECGGA
jgi:hypothetical protein